MGAIFILVVAIGLLAVFDLLVARYGVDSRVESRDPRRSPYPVAYN